MIYFDATDRHVQKEVAMTITNTIYYSADSVRYSVSRVLAPFTRVMIYVLLTWFEWRHVITHMPLPLTTHNFSNF